MTLFLVMLASLAMSRFIEKAYSEILGEALYVERDRFRVEAYSALEATIAILYEVSRIEGNLFAPEQGWDAPLEYAGVVFPEEMSIDISYVDEMGKISLPTAGRDRLLLLFEVLGFLPAEAEELADALLEWVSEGDPASEIDSNLDDYNRAALPYEAPRRPLRSFHELAAITGFRETFFDGQGVPNELFHQFTSMVSLYQFEQVNVNSASPAVMRIWSNLSEQDASRLATNEERAPMDFPYFRNVEEASAHFGMPLPSDRYSVTTNCIRINISVSEGTANFLLSTVVAPGPSVAARLLPAQGTAETQREQPATENRGGRRGRQDRTGQERATEAPAEQTIGYPFTFLEIRENETIL